MRHNIEEAVLVRESFMRCQPGDHIVYHVGMLAYDCWKAKGTIAQTMRANRAIARELYDVGEFELVQKRLGPECFEYRAVRRKVTTVRPPDHTFAFHLSRHLEPVPRPKRPGAQII